MDDRSYLRAGCEFHHPACLLAQGERSRLPTPFLCALLESQWRYFQYWSGYGDRLCKLLSGGTHLAPVAVIYHAEAEWSGEYEPFERVVKTLALDQIDCDVLPIDTLTDKEVLRLESGGFRVNNETYQALVIPFVERLPKILIQTLVELMES